MIDTLAEPASPDATHAGLTMRIYERMADVDPDEWDALLSPEDVQVSHRFIRTCQESGVEDAVYRHVMIERSGRLVAIASFSCMRVSLDLLSSGGTRAAIQWARSWRPSFLRLPVLLCGLPVSFGSPCVSIRRGEDPAPIVDALASHAESLAEELGARLVCFKEFSATESRAFERLRDRGYTRAASLPFCRLPIRWRSFDEYLGSTRTGYRRQILGSLRVARDAGLTLRASEDFASDCGSIFRLYEHVMDRAEYRLERLNQAFFQHLNVNLGRQSRALLVERDGTCLAAAILIDTPRALTFLLAGIDYERNRECHAYPFLVTQIVADAIRREARSLELGQTSYALKGRLGALAQPRWFYIKHRAAFRNAFLHAAAGTLFPRTMPPPRRVFKAARERSQDPRGPARVEDEVVIG